ncbi:MAG: helix-turn-helix transcriptional regulator [Bdellovibrio sp.]|nr:helix-turn-helix transcriptional regulator [Bdellovibrio sp.]
MSLELGTLLKEHRLKAGMTQQDLANKFGYSTAQFISNWERGISQPPMETLVQLSVLLKIPKATIKELLIKNAIQQIEKKIEIGFKRSV